MLVPIPASRPGHAQGRAGHDAARPSIFVLGTPSNFASTLTVDHAIRACGARSLIRPSPVERILRDLTFYLRHDNDDHILSTIGRSVLGQVFAPSFYKP